MKKIKNWKTGEIIIEDDNLSIKELIESADFSGADLRGANLEGADLEGASINDEKIKNLLEALRREDHLTFLKS